MPDEPEPPDPVNPNRYDWLRGPTYTRALYNEEIINARRSIPETGIRYDADDRPSFIFVGTMHAARRWLQDNTSRDERRHGPLHDIIVADHHSEEALNGINGPGWKIVVLHDADANLALCVTRWNEYPGRQYDMTVIGEHPNPRRRREPMFPSLDPIPNVEWAYTRGAWSPPYCSWVDPVRDFVCVAPPGHQGRHAVQSRNAVEAAQIRRQRGADVWASNNLAPFPLGVEATPSDPEDLSMFDEPYDYDKDRIQIERYNAITYTESSPGDAHRRVFDEAEEEMAAWDALLSPRERLVGVQFSQVLDEAVAMDPPLTEALFEAAERLRAEMSLPPEVLPVERASSSYYEYRRGGWSWPSLEEAEGPPEPDEPEPPS